MMNKTRQGLDLKQLRSIVEMFREGLLAGKGPRQKCFVVCLALSSYLRLQGISNFLTEGKVKKRHFHYWITLTSGEIVDPTASQFKAPGGEPMPAVYIGAKPLWYEAKP